MGYASPPRHWALTNSRPSADVTLITLRVADLAAASLEAFLNILRLFRSSKMSSVIVHQNTFSTAG
jgi:hypothetical protein